MPLSMWKKGAISVRNELRENGDMEMKRRLRFPELVSGVWDNLHNNRDEENFIEAVKSGDLEKLNQLLQLNRKLSVRSSDYRGFTVLELAILENQKEVIRKLLELDDLESCIEKAVLLAVREGNLPILKLLMAKTKKLEDAGVLKPDLNACFPRVGQFNVSPIMEAAMNDNLEITRLLRQYGHYIQDPAHPKPRGQLLCWGQCKTSSSKSSNDSLKAAVQLKNAYKALTSPCYIVHMDSDPIFTAFKLSKELKMLAEVMAEYKTEYLQMSEDCSTFATNLLNQCKDKEEVFQVMCRPEGVQFAERYCFPRLHLAKILSQKQFIAHPNSQHILKEAFAVSTTKWYTWPKHICLLYTLLHMLLAPFVLLVAIFHPDPLKMPLLNVPLNRAIYKFTMYAAFLCFILTSYYTREIDSYDDSERWVDLVVAAMVMGNFFESLQQLFAVGFTVFFGNFWTSYDLLMNSLFLVSKVFWTVAMFNPQDDPNSKRTDWAWDDPFLLGEGINAVAIVMAFCRVLFYLQIHPYLGPLKTSLRRMSADVLRFLSILFILVFSFGLGMNSIYRNYPEKGYVNDEGKAKIELNQFYSFKSTLWIMLWALYGKSHPKLAKLVVEISNSTDVDVQEVEERLHVFTQVIGYLLWAIFQTLTVIILLRMLTALMKDSFSRVQRNKDVVWKFERSSFWLSFLENQYTAPSPFNLVPSLSFLLRMIHNCKGSTTLVPVKQEVLLRRQEDGNSNGRKNELMKTLVMRLLQREETQLQETPLEDPTLTSSPSVPRRSNQSVRFKQSVKKLNMVLKSAAAANPIKEEQES